MLPVDADEHSRRLSTRWAISRPQSKGVPIKLVHNMKQIPISTCTDFDKLFENQPFDFPGSLYFLLPRLGLDHTTYQLQIGRKFCLLPIRPADNVVHSHDRYYKLVTRMDSTKVPTSIAGLKPLPTIVAQIGMLVLHDHGYGPITTNFFLIVDVQSALKDIWLIHDHLSNCFDIDHSCGPQCRQICADLLSLPEDRICTALVNRWTGEDYICDEHRALLGSSARDSYLFKNSPYFDIAYLGLSWDGLLSDVPEDLRRLQVARGVAQTARCAKARFGVIDAKELDRMAAQKSRLEVIGMDRRYLAALDIVDADCP